MNTAVQSQNPFGQPQMAEHVNHGTVHIEQSRAITEAQGKLLLAKKFPRDEARAFSQVLQSCSRISLAVASTYSYPRGGQLVTGPSIRLAEELARCWGNIEFGIRELSRQEGNSEMEAYAWDLETNTLSTQRFTVRHIRDKRGGGTVLTDERDIYETTSNMGSRRLRARLIAILPPDLVDAALEQCKKTIEGDVSIPMADRVKRLISSFQRVNVTEKMIRNRIGKSLDDVNDEDLYELHTIYTSLKSGQFKASEYFDMKRESTEANRLNEQMAEAQQSA
ncbi:hypothetical protein LMG33818_000922 [Halomonadaceae bacterium LMG 33818]|uniref:hypothetical protein n=1 Tax=Cernens ardua TaxID=3402176 RepID=UPI003EDC8486